MNGQTHQPIGEPRIIPTPPPEFYSAIDSGKKPHKCPVCGGAGQVRQSFYNPPGPYQLHSTTTFDPLIDCKGCAGTGVIIC